MNRIRTGLRMIRGVNTARMINAAKILYSYQRSRRTGVPDISGMPISISVEPTTSCNLRCPQCPSGLRQFTRPKGMLDPALFDEIITQTGNTLSYLTFYFQGEPYLNPAFNQMVRSASERGIFTATSTNAHFINAGNAADIINSGLGKLIISIDGITQETYEKYRVGGDLEKVWSGIRELVKVRKALRSSSPLISLQFIVFSHNEHELADARKLAREAGVDEIVFKTAQVYDDDGIAMLPENEDYSRYKVSGGSARIRGPLPDHCWRMWHSCVVTWDGLVVPCCFDKDASYRLGDLKEKSFREVWNGEEYRKFRTSLITNRKGTEICNNCSEGARVWI